jgi:hypothetical protein
MILASKEQSLLSPSKNKCLRFTLETPRLSLNQKHSHFYLIKTLCLFQTQAFFAWTLDHFCKSFPDLIEFSFN